MSYPTHNNISNNKLIIKNNTNSHLLGTMIQTSSNSTFAFTLLLYSLTSNIKQKKDTFAHKKLCVPFLSTFPFILGGCGHVE